MEGFGGCEGARDVRAVDKRDAFVSFEKINVLDVPVFVEPGSIVKLEDCGGQG